MGVQIRAGGADELELLPSGLGQLDELEPELAQQALTRRVA